jgi:hypothetical protein
MSNFLKTAIDELLIYRTPQAIVKIIEKKKIKLLIQNPTYSRTKKITTTISLTSTRWFKNK